jgi:hypothetical protein
MRGVTRVSTLVVFKKINCSAIIEPRRVVVELGFDTHPRGENEHCVVPGTYAAGEVVTSLLSGLELIVVDPTFPGSLKR